MPLQKVVRPLTGAWEDAQGEARERQEREERARKEEWERMARDREETLRREEDMRRQMPAIYAKWKQRCNNAFSAQPKTLMEFPHPPLIICYCTDILCTLAKSQQGALQVCQHEMHRLLMRSGEYSMKMLREWRNGFHSDKVSSFEHLHCSLKLIASADCEHIVSSLVRSDLPPRAGGQSNYDVSNSQQSNSRGDWVIPISLTMAASRAARGNMSTVRHSSVTLRSNRCVYPILPVIHFAPSFDDMFV